VDLVMHARMMMSTTDLRHLQPLRHQGCDADRPRCSCRNSRRMIPISSTEVAMRNSRPDIVEYTSEILRARRRKLLPVC